MSTHASGTFDANRTPYPRYDMAEGATLGRTTITKLLMTGGWGGQDGERR